MSIATRTGDDGTTGLMYNRRVPKTHARVESYGTVDELNAALGMARTLGVDPFVRGTLEAIQRQLVILMGELATAVADRERYVADGFGLVTPAMTAVLDGWVRQIESEGVRMDGWATPGATPVAAALDVARTTCRRAERRACVLEADGELPNHEVVIYLNRLSDLLWLMARRVETQSHADR